MKKPIPFGKYYLLERINVGGMAEVFRAKTYGAEGFERLVAVKRILPNIAEDKEFIRMFVDEAKIAVQLNHANVAQVFDLGVVDGSYYIAMEHVHGRDLRAIFDRFREQGATMSIAQAAFVIMKACEGLDYAHNKRDQSGRELNLVHRDVSPQNVLVSFEGEVKIIDFGIAKAAGKGSKTQAGILKGKFGYMSPEQVRGLPIDRRSDIFSCGIVLYELLTGERLFYGESDFSTLEKVRNAEILPPSTYNRKIPDELERIVLKALAKDHEDRYQNAIDLHDELQAFVYTAGEFYSRKDLAGSMKELFGREIEEETAKLESYRKLRPPEQGRDAGRGQAAAESGPPTGQSGRLPPPPRRSSRGMPALPPPIPGAGDGANGRGAGNGRASVGMGASMDAAAPPPPGLSWDDDELETQIYKDGDKPGQSGEQPIAAAPSGPLGRVQPPSPSPASTLPMAAMGQGEVAGNRDAPPDLSSPELASIVQTAKGWKPPSDAGAPPAPPNLARGSNPSPSPYGPGGAEPGLPNTQIRPGGPTESTAIRELISQAQNPPLRQHGPPGPPGPHGPQGPHGDVGPGASHSGMVPHLGSHPSEITGTSISAPPQRRRGAAIWIMLTVTVLALAGAGVGLYFAFVHGKQAEPDQPAVAPVAADAAPETAPKPQLSKEVLAQTGFDLVIEPRDVKVKLDGNVVDLPPPMKIRHLEPGDHQLVIEGPPGFFSKTQTVTVEEGKAPRIEVVLESLPVKGIFTSEPAGAEVTLVADGVRTPLGQAPVEHELRPRRHYEIIFEKDGYVSVTKALDTSGNSEERVVAVLARARTGPRRPPPTGNPDVKPDNPPDNPPTGTPPKPGVLLLGSKPPCRIFIDGRDTGNNTPQRIELPAGRHRVVLVNNEHGIRESFTVTIKPGEQDRVIKDMSDRIKK